MRAMAKALLGFMIGLFWLAGLWLALGRVDWADLESPTSTASLLLGFALLNPT
jgi:hypothetical protein